MKPFIYRLFALIFCSGLALPAQAVLVDRGGGLIYDTVLDVTWIADASLAQTQIGPFISWNDAVQWAEDLSYGGFDDWRLPNMDVNGDGTFVNCTNFFTTELECRDNEYDYLYWQYGVSTATPGLFSGINTQHYWSGTENPVFTTLAYLLNFDTGFRGTTSKLTTNREAWAVRDGDVVPLPAAIWLFGSGLLGLAGLRLFRR